MLDQLAKGERLLEMIFDEASRPSMQWLRKETAKRQMLFIKRGRFVFYRPRSVLEWFKQKEQLPASMTKF